MIDGREDRQHAVAVLHQPAMVLRAGGHALFLRVVRDLSDGGGQRGQNGLKGPQAGVALVEPGRDVVAEQRDARLRRDVDMPLDPADLRFHVGTAEIRARGVNRNVQTQPAGMVGQPAGEFQRRAAGGVVVQNQLGGRNAQLVDFIQNVKMVHRPAADEPAEAVSADTGFHICLPP